MGVYDDLRRTIKSTSNGISDLWKGDPLVTLLQLGSNIYGPVSRGMGYGAGRNNTGQIGAAIGQAAAGFANGATRSMGNLPQQQQQSDPLMDLYNQLVSQLQSPVKTPTGINTEDLMNQVKKAINPIYDQRAASAKSQGKTARKEVQGMYGALADDYKKLAPQQQAQAQAAQEEIEQMYGQLRSNVEGSYSRVANEQGELFKKLGIEAALPDVLGDQNAAVTDALTSASQNQAQQEQRYMDQGNIDATYYREGSPNAILTGNEVSTDMLTQLNDYLAQIEAERSSGIQSGYMDQYSQAQSQLAQQQQAAQAEAGRRQEMLWSMLQAQLSGQSKQQEITPDTFMSALPSQQQNSVAKAFTQLQRSPEAIYGKTMDPRNPVPGSFVETTPEWYLAQADQMLKSGQIDQNTHQLLLQYLQLMNK